jgi:hypothetical protein
MLKKHDCYIKKVIEEYDQIYGLNRKVVKFFTENCTEEEKNEILISIKYYNKSKTLVSFLEDNKDIGDFASLLYKMRSDFVHNAEMHMFPGDSVSGYWFFLGKELYQITLKEKRLLEIFEKSFVNFYKTNNKKTEFI